MTRLRAFVNCRVLTLAFLVVLSVLGGQGWALEVQQVQSPRGISFWLYEDHGTPVTSIDFAFVGAGATADANDKQGVASLAAGTMDEGAGPFNSLAFQKRMDDLGAGVSFRAGRDHFSGTLTSLSATMPQSIEMLRLALTAPRFDRDALQRIKGQILSILARDAQNPNTIAARHWMAQSFPGHGYGRPVRGTQASVGALTRSDLTAFVATRLGHNNVRLSVVGDVTPAEAGRLIDRAFGDLPAVALRETTVEIKPAATGTDMISLPIPQTILQFGMPGILRDDADFLPAYVLNHILGGGSFSSRLMIEVREKRGLTYGIGTGLAPYQQAGTIMGSFATKNESAGQAMEIVRDVIADIAANGVTADELAKAKQYLIGAYPLRFDSNDKIAGQLLGLQLAGLDPNYFVERNDLIAAVTLDDLRRVATRLLKVDQLYVVAVGQPTGLDAQPHQQPQ